MLALLAGCGGGGGSSNEDFVAAANKICKDVNDKGNAVAKPQKTSEIRGYIDTVEPIFEDGIHQIEDLSPPDDKKSQFDTWVSTLHQQEDLVESAKEKADSGDTPAAVAALQKIDPVDKKGNEQARALGLTECAKSGSGSSGSSGSS